MIKKCRWHGCKNEAAQNDEYCSFDCMKNEHDEFFAALEAEQEEEGE